MAIAAMAALMIMPTAVADRRGEGMRIDFLDQAGKRILSGYPEDYAQNRYVFFQVSGNERDGYMVMNSRGRTGSIKFTPWGEESYPLTVRSEENGVKASYAVIDSNGSPVAGMKTRGGEEVKCGTMLRIYVEVPEGKFPRVEMIYDYTGMWDEDGKAIGYTRSAMTLEWLTTFKFVGTESTNPATRKTIVDYLNGNGGFEREAGTGRWYFDMMMPNEPFVIKASADSPDGSVLRSCVMRALTGLYTQFGNLTTQPSNSSEGFIMNVFGDCASQDFISGVFSVSEQNAKIVTGLEMLKRANLVLTAIPWSNNFALITHANMVLSQIDKFTAATQAERDVARAQMLTLRSHAYFRLLQMYGSRWSESEGGSRLCAPLERSLQTENVGLATMKEIADQCYMDLDEAIALLKKTGYKRSDIVEPDLDVARGVKLRVAMLREDWQTAASLGDELLASKSLTSNADLKGGFYKPAESWIWGAWNRDLYYWSYQAFNACNGAYPAGWGVGPNAIDKDLYVTMGTNDVRRSLYALPESSMELFGKWETWYNSAYAGKQAGHIFAFLDGKTENASTRFYRFYMGRKPSETETTPAFASFMDVSQKMPVPMGAQIKFYQPGRDITASAALVMMRSEEVLLSSAEAYLRLGNEVKSRELLNRLNTMRDNAYSCTKKGDELLKEIQRTRKIELWGEGHSWFDQKRWNLPIVRRHWKEGDKNSGNWGSWHAESVATDFGNGWRFPIPAYALKHNTEIDVSKMGYTGVEGYGQSSSQVAPAISVNLMSPERIKVDKEMKMKY